MKMGDDHFYFFGADLTRIHIGYVVPAIPNSEKAIMNLPPEKLRDAMYAREMEDRKRIRGWG